MSKITDFLSALKDNNGATFSISTGELNPSTGYMVSVFGSESTFSANASGEERAEYVRTFVNKNAYELCKKGMFLGAWIYEGLVYLDISKNISNKRAAMTEGYLNAQLAIFDCAELIVIQLSHQKNGTEAQKRMYQEMYIDRVCKA
jgi:hypothetical protein